MGLYEFNLLSDTEKANAVWDGTYLTMRSENHFRINLYSLYNFFVEVWYDSTDNQITQFRSFQSKSKLEPYTQTIDLNSLL